MSRVTEDTAEYIIKYIPKKIKEEKISVRSLMSEKEKYISDTFGLSMEVVRKLTSLHYSYIFLKSYPTLWKKTLKRVDYIKYHLEAYYNNLIGIFDRCLLLVNFIYDLGFQEKYVRYNLIISNSHIKKEKVGSILNSFYTALSKIREYRNLITHREEIKDEELTPLSTYETVKQNDPNI